MEDVSLPDDDAADNPSGASSAFNLRVLSQLLTILVAVSAIALSVWEGVEMRRHNRLSVLPSLEAGGIWTGTRLSLENRRGSFRQFFPDSVEAVYQDSITLANNGLGPAVLHRVQARLGDSITYDTERPEHRKQFVFQSLISTIRETTPGALLTNVRTYPTGTLFPRGTHQVLNVVIPAPSRPDGAQIVRRRLQDVLPHISVLYCSCSIYGENCSTTSFWNRDVPDDFVCRPFVRVAE